MNHAKHQEDVREGLDSPTFPMWAVDAVWECPGDASLRDTALPAYVVSTYSCEMQLAEQNQAGFSSSSWVLPVCSSLCPHLNPTKHLRWLGVGQCVCLSIWGTKPSCRARLDLKIRFRSTIIFF